MHTTTEDIGKNVSEHKSDYLIKIILKKSLAPKYIYIYFAHSHVNSNVKKPR